MSLPLDLLFKQVAGAIQNHASPNTPGPSYNANPLLGALQSAFGQYANQTGSRYDPHPDYDQGEEYANQYGPLDFNQGAQQNHNQQGQFGNVLPASQDPYGDPADQPGQGQFGNVLPASQDPYGDPADQERRY
jgi:hypothetical protein